MHSFMAAAVADAEACINPISASDFCHLQFVLESYKQAWRCTFLGVDTMLAYQKAVHCLVDMHANRLLAGILVSQGEASNLLSVGVLTTRIHRMRIPHTMQQAFEGPGLA